MLPENAQVVLLVGHVT